MSLSEQQLLELFEKLLKGTLSEQERECLHYAAIHDDNVAEMLRFLEKQADSLPTDIEAQIVYEKTRPNSLNLIESPVPTKSIRRYLRPLFAVAAVIVAFAFCWLAFYKGKPVAVKEQWQTVRTQKGERKFFKLVDGTEIWLNNESELKVKSGYGSKHRDISLVGEAYFSVAKNKKLPLHVHTAEALIEVLGTVFNVRSYPDDHQTETSLIEGKVKLNVTDNTKQEYILTPGDRVVVSKRGTHELHKNSQHAVEAVDLQVVYKKINPLTNEGLELKWIENKLVLNADPLPSVVEKLSRWYNRVIIVKSDKQQHKEFSGVFQEPECEDVLKFLNQTGGQIKYTVERDTIFID